MHRARAPGELCAKTHILRGKKPKVSASPEVTGKVPAGWQEGSGEGFARARLGTAPCRDGHGGGGSARTGARRLRRQRELLFTSV